MRNLISAIQDNTGGLELCLFTDWENLDLANWPETDGLKLIGNLPLKSGATWYQLGYTRDTNDYDQTNKQDRAGSLYQHAQKGFLPYDSPELGTELYDLSRRRLAILFKDRNGYLRLCATPENWLNLTYKLTTGGQPSERNGYQLSFSGESPLPAYYYSGSFEVSEIGVIAPIPAGTGGNSQPVTIKKGNGEVVAVIQPGQTFIINSGFSWGFNII